METLKEVITELRATQAVVRALIAHKVIDTRSFETAVILQTLSETKELSPKDAEAVRDAAQRLTID